MKTLLVIGGMLIVFGLGFIVGEIGTYNKLSKDVQMEQVSVKGENRFLSQIEHIYKDGRWISTELVPGTTVPEPKK